MRAGLSRRSFLKIASACAAAGWVANPGMKSLLAAQEAQSDVALSEWESFRGGTANLGLAAGLPDSLELKWEIEAADGVPSTPVIADGKAFVGTLSGDLHCVELKSGKKLWKYRTMEKVPANDFPPGFVAPLALDQHNIFGGDDRGTFHAVSRDTGQKSWTVETDGEIVGGAQVVDGKVLFGSHDGFLYCHQAENGEQVWKAETFGPVNGTPCIAGKYTFTTGCDQPILRVFDIEAGKQAAEVPIDALLIASAAYRDELLYYGTDEGSVYSLNWQTKETIWKHVPEQGRSQPIHSSPAVTEDRVVIGSRDKNLYCLDRATGEEVWRFPTRGRIDSSPVIAGDRVYFGATDRMVYGVLLETGKEFWKSPAGNPISGSPAIADGHLVIGTESSGGKVLCFGGG